MAAATILIIFCLLAALRIPVAIAMIAAGLVGAAATLDVPVWRLFTTMPTTAITSGFFVPSMFLLFLLTGLVRATIGSRQIFEGLKSGRKATSGGGALLAILGFGLGSAMGDSMDRRGAVAVRDRLTVAGYSEASAMGVLLGAASFRYVVPVSAVVVFGGYLMEQSVSRLMLAMALPAVLLAIFLLAIAGIAEFRRRGPDASSGSDPSPANRGKLALAIIGIAVSVTLILLMTNLVASGATTAAEAFSIAAFFVLVAAFVICLIGLARWSDLFEAFAFAAGKTAEIVLILIAAMLIGQALHLSGFSQAISDIPVNGSLMLLLSLLGIVVLAALFGAIPAMALGSAIAFPLSMKIGGDALWTVCVIIAAAAFAQTLPYIGRTNRFLAQCFPDATAGTLTRGALPYAAALLVWLVLIFLVPELSIGFPNIATG